MTPSPQALLDVARRAALAAGDHVMTQLARRTDINKVERHDIKHKLDCEAQEIATATIRAAFPNDAILGEETADAPLPDTPVRWVIDPIDGTVNFTHGLPIWCCSVAAQIHGRSVAGAVWAPELKMLFEAHADGPALCNGVPMHVSDTDRLDRALIHTGADKGDFSRESFRFLNLIAGAAQRPRVFGSAALDICFVAAGKTDSYFEPGVFLWDVAAAGLILERAGGIGDVLRAYPGHKQAFLATTPNLNAALRDLLLPLL